LFKWCRKPEFDGVLEFCAKNELTFLPWSPVGGGYKYLRLLKVTPLVELAAAKNCSVYSLVLTWLRQKSPCVVVIPGASKISSIEDSVKSLEVKLSDDEMKKIDTITESLK
jgi:aryl-alcohol dehydrogenase-like predicted oxidoreductase